ncbi:MAG: hypothetical protein ACXWKW_05090 [Asticcacaulis sp.]
MSVAALVCTSLFAGGCTPHKPKAPPPQTVAPYSASLKQRLDAEAVWLRQYPQLATRDGDTLVLHYAGKEIARYVNDPKGCNPYSIKKVLRLYDRASGTLEPVAEVACHFGPIDNRYIVRPSGDKYVVQDDVSASPDGRLIAMSDSSPKLTQGQFMLMDWPDLTTVAAFRAGCHDLKWQDDSRLTALCWHNNGTSPQDPNDSRTIYFQADIRHAGHGDWQMQATAFVDPVSLKPQAANGRPLPRLTAYVPPADKP